MSSLALKYRPSSFDDLVGQLHASRSLKNAIEQKQIGHAYLFFGSRGVGKTSTARILAKSLNCLTNGASTSPCGTCDNCRDISTGNCIDVLEMDAASNRGIDHIRELRESARFSPMRSPYKIYIIDEVHMLTNESFNALLKILEEPPSHVIFIMATTEYHKIPETILSRCQSFAFRKFSHQDLENRLRYVLEQEAVAFEEKSLLPIIQKAEGSMRDALSLTDQVIAFCGNREIHAQDVEQVLGITPIKVYLDFLASVKDRNSRAALLQIDQLHINGTNLKQFLWDFLAFVKNALLIKADICDNKSVLMSDQDYALLQEVLNSWDQAELTAVFEHFYKLYANWNMFQSSKSSEIRVTLEVSIIHLFHLLNQPTISGLMQRISDLKNAIQQGVPYQDTPSLSSAQKQNLNESQEKLSATNTMPKEPTQTQPRPQEKEEVPDFTTKPATSAFNKDAKRSLNPNTNNEQKTQPSSQNLNVQYDAARQNEKTFTSIKGQEQENLPSVSEANAPKKDTASEADANSDAPDIDSLIKQEFLASEEETPPGLFDK